MRRIPKCVCVCERKSMGMNVKIIHSLVIAITLIYGTEIKKLPLTTTNTPQTNVLCEQLVNLATYSSSNSLVVCAICNFLVVQKFSYAFFLSPSALPISLKLHLRLYIYVQRFEVPTNDYLNRIEPHNTQLMQCTSIQKN